MKTVVALAAAAAVSWTLVGAASSSADVVDHGVVVSANPDDWTPDVLDGKVRQTATVGDVTVAVGDFTQVRSRGSSTVLDRTAIFAFDSSGQVSTTFTPVIGGTDVLDVVDSGDGRTVYVVGGFANVNGELRTAKIARLDVTTGQVVASFKSPGFNNRLTEVQLVEDRLFVGGWFTQVNGVPRTLLAELNPATGADTGNVDLAFGGTWNGGTMGVTHLTVAPDLSRMLVVGNFRTVDGQSRPQIAMVDTSATPAALSSWSTTRYGTTCSRSFTSYVADVDIDPTSTYFVVGTTGAYSGGPAAGTLCDTVARWELTREGAGQEPTWIDYTGGDTVWQVEATGSAVYVGGHFRWMNNPYANDRTGPGAVGRKGLAALDPRNGLPLTWNPGRLRGWGVWGFRAAADGLWIGHDTAKLGGEDLQRIAFMPVLGGTTPPLDRTGSLPGSVFQLGGPPPAPNGSSVLYRVNAGGPMVLSKDEGPDWAADTSAAPSPLHNSGNVSATWLQSFGRTANVPASTPQSIFSVERADPSSLPEMTWDFPVAAGTPIQLRLYFASGCSCTSTAGKRKFDVKVDGSTWLKSYDIVAEVGHSVGTMKTIDLVSDGNVDVDFLHVVENPLVNGIEIVRTDMAPSITPTDVTVKRLGFDGSSVTSQTAPTNVGLGTDWAQVRGAFMVDNALYTGTSDGRLLKRLWKGSSFGLARSVNLNTLTSFSNDLASTRAVFFDRELGRLYFTQAGVGRLYYRYFTPESGVVGGIRFEGPANQSGIDWGTARGAFLAHGQLYVTTDNGHLVSGSWVDGTLSGPVATVSGPGVDGVDWRSRGLFLMVE